MYTSVGEKTRNLCRFPYSYDHRYRINLSLYLCYDEGFFVLSPFPVYNTSSFIGILRIYCRILFCRNTIIVYNTEELCG